MISKKIQYLVTEHWSAVYNAGVLGRRFTTANDALITAIEELEAKVTAQGAEIAALKAELRLWQGAFVNPYCPSDHGMANIPECDESKEDWPCDACWKAALTEQGERVKQTMERLDELSAKRQKAEGSAVGQEEGEAI